VAKSPKDMTFAELCELLSYTPKNRLLIPLEVCEILGVTDQTLRMGRINGDGPRYIKNSSSRLVRYSEIDILRWVASGLRTSTSEQLPGQQPRPWDKSSAA
jgi:predicted DNA-binding transcriptional regulator AlpA